MNITDAFIFCTTGGILLLWLLYDIAVLTFLGARFGTLTITRELQRISSKYIVIPFMSGLILGLICGHLFGQF